LAKQHGAKEKFGTFIKQQLLRKGEEYLSRGGRGSLADTEKKCSRGEAKGTKRVKNSDIEGDGIQRRPTQ